MEKHIFENGDHMPLLGLGTWKSRPGEVYQAVRTAINVGYRHIDCAHIYQNEQEIGKALTDAFKAGDVKRENVWITSKLWNNAHLTDDVRPALETTLQHLQLDYLDVYLMHWPVALQPGVGFPASEEDYISLEEIPLSTTWQAMEACAEVGLTRHIGVSNFSVQKIRQLLENCRIRPEVNQIELQPFLAQNEMLSYCKDEHIAVTAYSPLGSPDRPSQFKSPDEPSLLQNPVIEEIAAARGCSTAQVLIRWAIQRGTSVIPKSVNPERIRQNFEAQQLQLGEAEMKAISKLDRHERVVKGDFWNAPSLGYTIKSLWDE
jgi:alcohol dehydrogenase (NADP+)